MTSHKLTVASASGNVFAYVWSDEAPLDFDGPRWTRILSPRGSGLSLDGLFLLQRPEHGQTWRMEHWEADGTRTFCSNGTRAAAALLPSTWTGELDLLCSDEKVRLRLEGEKVGLCLPEGPGYGLMEMDLTLDFPYAYGWTGTPHLVLEVPDVEAIHLPSFAPALRFHARLPHGANVSILQVLKSGHARIRSWERGVEGETLCCGQGCAVAAAWLAKQTGVEKWELQPAGRDAVTVSVKIQPNGSWRELWLSGPVRIIGQFTPHPSLGLG